ncbi:hypothetical protein [Aquimarina sp. AU58]|uniref:hypothetical protein n=1 Tax=Aquimarina sp. AU58 TaxID=1874112 RepID=UPI001359A99D|nr:hypothetical protein [Aquimarina sp. AU58]
MIIWSGRGILSVLMLIITLVISIKILPKEQLDYGFIIATYASGLFSWFFGYKWNTKPDRVVIDEKTKERIMIKRNHTLFWIKMQYWGIIFWGLGLVLLTQKSLYAAIVSALIFASLIIMRMINKQKKKYKIKTKLIHKVKDQSKTLLQSPIEISKKTEEEKQKQRLKKEDHSRFMPK